MFERYSIIGLFFALTILLFDFFLLRKQKIKGKGFAFWFMIGVVLGLFSTVPFLYSLLTLIYGTQETISAVTATTFLFFLLMLLYMHSRISELQTLLMKLSMEISLIRYEQGQTEQASTKVKSENAGKQNITYGHRNSKRRSVSKKGKSKRK